RQHVLQAHKLGDIRQYQDLDAGTALELIAAEGNRGDDQLSAIITQRFLYEGDRRAGFYVLLFSARASMHVPAPKRQLLPVEEYVRRVEGGDWRINREALDTFVGRVSAFHALAKRLPGNNLTAADFDEALRFVKECGTPAQAWAITSCVVANTAAPI